MRSVLPFVILESGIFTAYQNQLTSPLIDAPAFQLVIELASGNAQWLGKLIAGNT